MGGASFSVGRARPVREMYADVEVSPTFTSTDLITPFCKSRSTLPTIAKCRRPVYSRQLNCWGSNTINSKSLRREVTHLKYGSGCFNYHAPVQPYRITTLLLSHCRRNDQILYPPEKGPLIHENIALQYPRDPPYMSHLSRFSVFPQPFTRCSKHQSHTERLKGLSSLQQSLYCTTSYREAYNEKQSIGHLGPEYISNNASQSISNNQEKPKEIDHPVSMTPADNQQDLKQEADVESCEENCKGTQTDEWIPSVEEMTTSTKKEFSVNPILEVNFGNSDQLSEASGKPALQDVSTQTMYSFSLVDCENMYSVFTTLTDEVVPATLPLTSSTTEDVKSNTKKADYIRKRPGIDLISQEDWLTFKLRAHQRFNQKYGEDHSKVNRLAHYGGKGKKMFFYGEHTSIFRG